MAKGRADFAFSAGITTRGPLAPSGQDERRDRPELYLARSSQW